jgi:hypothetical protein
MAAILKFELKNHQHISEAPSNQSKIQVDIKEKKAMVIG